MPLEQMGVILTAFFRAPPCLRFAFSCMSDSSITGRHFLVHPSLSWISWSSELAIITAYALPFASSMLINRNEAVGFKSSFDFMF